MPSSARTLKTQLLPWARGTFKGPRRRPGLRQCPGAGPGVSLPSASGRSAPPQEDAAAPPPPRRGATSALSQVPPAFGVLEVDPVPPRAPPGPALCSVPLPRPFSPHFADGTGGRGTDGEPGLTGQLPYKPPPALRPPLPAPLPCSGRPRGSAPNPRLRLPTAPASPPPRPPASRGAAILGVVTHVSATSAAVLGRRPAEALTRLPWGGGSRGVGPNEGDSERGARSLGRPVLLCDPHGPLSPPTGSSLGTGELLGGGCVHGSLTGLSPGGPQWPAARGAPGAGPPSLLTPPCRPCTHAPAYARSSQGSVSGGLGGVESERQPLRMGVIPTGHR